MDLCLESHLNAFASNKYLFKRKNCIADPKTDQGSEMQPVDLTDTFVAGNWLKICISSSMKISKCERTWELRILTVLEQFTSRSPLQKVQCTYWLRCVLNHTCNVRNYIKKIYLTRSIIVRSVLCTY